MDFTKKENITNSVIIIFIILSLTYLYNINNNKKNQNAIETIETFGVLTEDQNIGGNNVSIDNLRNVGFGDPNVGLTTLQTYFDRKLDNSGVVGGAVNVDGNYLQGIILNNAQGVSVVKIGNNITFGPATTATTINEKAIQFGGANAAAKDGVSAQISIDVHEKGSLCLVGMDKEGTGRKIDMWADGAAGRLRINGPVTITGAGTINGGLTVTAGGLAVTGAGTISNGLTVAAGGLAVTGSGVIRGGLTVNDGATTCNGALTVSGKTTTPGGINAGSGLIETTHIVQAGGMRTGWMEASSTLSVASTLTVGGELNITTTIRKKQNVETNLHIVSQKSLYIMAKENVIIYKAPGSAEWDNPAGNLIVENNLRVDGSLSFLPIGCIIMWGRRNVGVPDGWRICDGGDGTPDFSGHKFPLSGGIGQIGYGGGGHGVSFTISEAQMPRHSHAIHTGSGTGSTPAGRVTQYDQKWDNGFKWDDIIAPTGGNQPVNLTVPWQPYIHVVYIMRIR